MVINSRKERGLESFHSLDWFNQNYTYWETVDSSIYIGKGINFTHRKLSGYLFVILVNFTCHTFLQHNLSASLMRIVVFGGFVNLCYKWKESIGPGLGKEPGSILNIR